MSDDPTPEGTPPPAPPLPVAAEAATGHSPRLGPEDEPRDPGQDQPGTPGLPPPTTVPQPVLEYTMPAPKRPMTIPKNLGGLVKMVFGFCVLILMGYFALMALSPQAREWATKDGGPTPFKALNQILAIPAQAIGKTTDVVVANDKRVGQLDGLIAAEEGKNRQGGGSRPVVDPFARPAPQTGQAGSAGAAEATASAPQSVSSATLLAPAGKNAARSSPPPTLPAVASHLPDDGQDKSRAGSSQQRETAGQTPVGQQAGTGPTSRVVAPAPDSPEQMKLAGDIIIAHASPAGAPRASAAFFYWVVNLNVSGITQGKPARLLLNNRLAYEGDEVNRTLGVVFAQLDPANKLIVFRDQTGATVTRSY